MVSVHLTSSALALVRVLLDNCVVAVVPVLLAHYVCGMVCVWSVGCKGLLVPLSSSR